MDADALTAPVTLADNLKQLRHARDLTQEELAFKAGLKQNAISRYEKGKAKPDLDTCLKLATGLDVPLETLVKGLDMKFDAMYEGLRISISTDPHKAGENGSAFAEPPPLSDVLHGAPSGGGHEAAAITDMASAREALRRATSDLLSILNLLSAGSDSVARDLGPELRPRATRARRRKGEKDSAYAPQEKRR